LLDRSGKKVLIESNAGLKWHIDSLVRLGAELLRPPYPEVPSSARPGADFSLGGGSLLDLSSPWCHSPPVALLPVFLQESLSLLSKKTFGTDEFRGGAWNALRWMNATLLTPKLGALRVGELVEGNQPQASRLGLIGKWMTP